MFVVFLYLGCKRLADFTARFDDRRVDDYKDLQQHGSQPAKISNAQDPSKSIKIHQNPKLLGPNIQSSARQSIDDGTVTGAIKGLRCGSVMSLGYHDNK